MLKNKIAYYQDTEEPTPGQKKYKSDPAIVVQPRFKEPFYHNYDIYEIPGLEHIGPGAGWHHMSKYKSIQEFLEDKRKKLKGKYVADDSWQLNNGSYVKKNPARKARMVIFDDLIKKASDENDGHDKKDSNDIDFPIDEEVNHQNQMIYPIEDEYEIRREKGDKYQFPSAGSDLGPENLNISMTTPQIAGEHSYLPEPDFEGKSDNGSQLNFGRDYVEETLPGRSSDFNAINDNKEINLNNLESKYLESTEMGLFGLPDGVDPEGHDSDQTEQIERPYDTVSDIGNNMYEDKWNI